jgi:bacteriocin-like protein
MGHGGHGGELHLPTDGYAPTLQWRCPNRDRATPPITKETIMADTKQKPVPKPANTAKPQAGGKKDRKDELNIDELAKVSGGRKRNNKFGRT